MAPRYELEHKRFRGKDAAFAKIRMLDTPMKDPPLFPTADRFTLSAHLGVGETDPPLFATSAGSSDPVAQIEYAASVGFGAISDNNLLRRSADEQVRIGRALGRTGLRMASFVLLPHGTHFPWTLPGSDVESALECAHATAQRVGGGVALIAIREADGGGRQAQIDVARLNLDRASRIAAKLELRLAVEAASSARFPGSLVERVEDAAALVTEIGQDSLRMIVDTCHMTLVGDDPIAVIRRLAPIIASVQIADMPGRVEPGGGILDLAAVVRELRAAMFDGFVEAEFWLTRPGRRGERKALSALRTLFAPVTDESTPPR